MRAHYPLELEDDGPQPIRVAPHCDPGLLVPLQEVAAETERHNPQKMASQACDQNPLGHLFIDDMEHLSILKEWTRTAILGLDRRVFEDLLYAEAPEHCDLYVTHSLCQTDTSANKRL